MKHLSESILSKKTGLYALRPDKKSIVVWLEKNRFEEILWSSGMNIYSFKNTNCYMIGPAIPNRKKTDWVKVHNDDILSLTFWFDKNGTVEEIEYEPSLTKTQKLEFEDAKKILTDIIQ